MSTTHDYVHVREQMTPEQFRSLSAEEQLQIRYARQAELSRKAMEWSDAWNSFEPTCGGSTIEMRMEHTAQLATGYQDLRAELDKL